MPEQNKLIQLEQEIINKKMDMFIEITTILGQLLKQGLAIFTFDYKETAISFDSSPEVRNAFSQYSPEKVQSVTEEVVDLTLMLLDKQEEQLLNQAQNEGTTAYSIMQKKINIIKEQIITNKLQNGYVFYRTSIAKVLEQFVAQRIIKPATREFPAVETVMIKITTKDNLDSANRQTIIFESYLGQLEDIINTLTELKQEFNSKKNNYPPLSG